MLPLSGSDLYDEEESVKELETEFCILEQLPSSASQDLTTSVPWRDDSPMVRWFFFISMELNHGNYHHSKVAGVLIFHLEVYDSLVVSGLVGHLRGRRFKSSKW